MTSHFSFIDWIVVVGFLVGVTVLGARLSRRPATIRDFFLAGRTLPWYAVSGSIISTEISAVTFVGVPAMVFAAGGDFTYLQLALGAVLAKIIVAAVFVPAFYEREIYSPYDYMEQRLGRQAKTVTTALFVVGQLLGQGVRVYLTAKVLVVVTEGRLSVEASIWVMGFVAILWTWLGGMATIVWTDVLTFLVFVAGAVVSLVYIVGLLPGGMGELLSAGYDAGKFRLFDFSTDPTLDFTLWAGLFAATLFNLNAYGTDQLIAQRMFCCRDRRAAQWATASSSVGLIVAVLMLFVGVGLFSYYQHFGMSAADAAAITADRDRIFPLFIVRVLPVGMSGLLVASIFAATISGLDSALAALAQTTLAVMPWGAQLNRKDASAVEAEDDPRALVWKSRWLVLAWGVVLSGMAYVSQWAEAYHRDILRLALSMASYTGGALLATFMLAFLRVNVDGTGLIWAAPVSVLAVFAAAWHQPWAGWTCWIVGGAVLLLWAAHQFRRPETRSPGKTLWLLAAVGIVLAINRWGYWDGPADPVTNAATWRAIAWPWYVLIGFAIAFPLGYMLGEPRYTTSREAEPVYA